jgi:hypothetical protein
MFILKLPATTLDYIFLPILNLHLFDDVKLGLIVRSTTNFKPPTITIMFDNKNPKKSEYLAEYARHPDYKDNNSELDPKTSICVSFNVPSRWNEDFVKLLSQEINISDDLKKEIIKQNSSDDEKYNTHLNILKLTVVEHKDLKMLPVIIVCPDKQ